MNKKTHPLSPISLLIKQGWVDRGKKGGGGGMTGIHSIMDDQACFMINQHV